MQDTQMLVFCCCFVLRIMNILQDMETILSRVVPDSWNDKSKNNSDITSTAKARNILVGSDITIPILDGILNMGQWQGIWLCEHSNNPTERNVVVCVIVFVFGYIFYFFFIFSQINDHNRHKSWHIKHNIYLGYNQWTDEGKINGILMVFVFFPPF